MNCIDLTSKGSKMLSYVANHSKQRQTTKVIKKQWLASIWCQNDQSNAKLWTWSNYNELHRFDVQTIKNVELRRRTFKTAELQKWSNWTSKRSKMLSYVANHSKPLNYKSDQIGRQNELKCWVTSQTIQNNAKLQKWSKNNDLHRFDVKTIKATQNSKRDQIPMNLHRFEVLMIKNVELRRKPFKTAKLQKWSNWTSKRAKMMSYVAKHSKLRKTTKSIKLQWIASIWRQNDLKCWLTSQTIQNNAKLQKWSKNNDLHRFDVKTIKATQNFESDQIIMNCIDLTSKRSKMLSYVAEHSKPLNYKSDQIGRQNDLKCWVTSQTIQNR